MALSNIFKEPRREILETVVGVAAVSALVLLDYEFAMFVQTSSGLDKDGGHSFPWEIGMVLGPMVAVAGGALLYLISIVTHAIGEGICGSLEKRGINIRPRQRRKEKENYSSDKGWRKIVVIPERWKVQKEIAP